MSYKERKERKKALHKGWIFSVPFLLRQNVVLQDDQSDNCYCEYLSLPSGITILTTVICCSHICDNVSFRLIKTMIARADRRNGQADIAGILLFSGTRLLQPIEEPEEKVRNIYQTIVLDPRHYNLVELFCDYIPSHQFGKVGTEPFDLWKHDREEVLQVMMDRGTTKYQLTYDDRTLQFFRTFIESTEKANYFEVPSAGNWVFIPDKDTFYPDTPIIDNTESQSFTFQPIVGPFACKIVSWEALLRTPDGQSPDAYFTGLAGDDVYLADPHSKRIAPSLAGKSSLRNKVLSINLLPMMPVKAWNAMTLLFDETSRNDLVPEQVIAEFTKREVISRMVDFTDTIRKLKGAGINLATDYLGAGSAGLSLLAQYQLDRIKVDHELTRNIHQNRPRQSIVQAIIKCCTFLEIVVSAVGVGHAEKWMWLESAGISQFQGNLFASAHPEGLPAVAWPEKK